MTRNPFPNRSWTTERGLLYVPTPCTPVRLRASSACGLCGPSRLDAFSPKWFDGYSNLFLWLPLPTATSSVSWPIVVPVTPLAAWRA